MGNGSTHRFCNSCKECVFYEDFPECFICDNSHDDDELKCDLCTSEHNFMDNIDHEIRICDFCIINASNKTIVDSMDNLYKDKRDTIKFIKMIKEKRRKLNKSYKNPYDAYDC